MTDHRRIEIQKGIIRAMSAFGIDDSLQYQSMSFVGLSEMRRDITRSEIVAVLKSMEGVLFDLEAAQVKVPTHYFKR